VDISDAFKGGKKQTNVVIDGAGEADQQPKP
jgi:hypothetical protein